jgi:hypothetical protein
MNAPVPAYKAQLGILYSKRFIIASLFKLYNNFFLPLQAKNKPPDSIYKWAFILEAIANLNPNHQWA